MVNPGGATVIKGTSPTHKRKDHHRWSAVLIGQQCGSGAVRGGVRRTTAMRKTC
jgi:hypothetical protein